MKKVTIVLFIVLCVCVGVRCYHESQLPPEPFPFEHVLASQVNLNNQLTIYENQELRGTQVKALFNLVEALNRQESFPINIRYGDVLPDSYNWNAQTTENLNPENIIRDSAYYEVVMQDQLPENNVDGYLDTITIRAYEQPVTANNITSSSGE